MVHGKLGSPSACPPTRPHVQVQVVGLSSVSVFVCLRVKPPYGGGEGVCVYSLAMIDSRDVAETWAKENWICRTVMERSWDDPNAQ